MRHPGSLTERTQCFFFGRSAGSKRPWISYGEAAAHCGKLPTEYLGKNMCLGRALLFEGRTEEAIRTLIKKRSDLAYLGYAYARSGRPEEAKKLAV